MSKMKRTHGQETAPIDEHVRFAHARNNDILVAHFLSLQIQTLEFYIKGPRRVAVADDDLFRSIPSRAVSLQGQQLLFKLRCYANKRYENELI